MHQARIAGELVELRPARPDDLELLVGWLHDPEVYRWWGGHPVPEEEIRQKYTGARSPRVRSYIIERDRVPVGYAQSWRAGELSGGIDMFLAPDARGRGLGTDAARALADHLTYVEGWRRVTVDPEEDNARALHMWRRAGFVQTGQTTSDGRPELVFRPQARRRY
jgi:aminoglycoside 6'-N-acetyltransferase